MLSLYTICMVGDEQTGRQRTELYRWKYGKWAKVKELPLIANVETDFFIHHITEWTSNQYLVFAWDGDSGNRFYVIAESVVSHPPPVMIQGGERIWRTDAMHALQSGEVFVAFQDRLLAWKPGWKGFRPIDEPLRGCAPHGFSTFGQSLLALGAKKEGACSLIYESGAWREYSVPEGETEASSAARDGQGGEWMVTFKQVDEKKPLVSSLWKRREGQAWAKMKLPPPRLSRMGGPLLPLEPGYVQATGEHDVWVTASYEEQCQRGVVLHNAPSAEACRVDNRAYECVQASHEETRIWQYCRPEAGK